MSGNPQQTWIEGIRSALDTVTTEGWSEELAVQWAAAAAAPRTRIVLYGPYNAGKTTLIARLLADAGTPVPQALVTGATPTTSDAFGASCGKVEFIDTPGIDAGRAYHAERAVGATEIADAVLVVLTHQLMTGPTPAAITALATGSRFNSRSPLPMPEGSLQFVIARADLGYWPQDDSEEYRRWCAGRRSELVRQLGSRGVDIDESSIHVVTACLHGVAETAGSESPGFDDGIEALRHALDRLPRRHAELREAAEVRFWASVASTGIAEAEAELTRVSEACEQARVRSRQARTLVRQARAVGEEGEQALKNAVTHLLDDLANQPPGPGGMDGVEDALRRRLPETVDRWFASQRPKLRDIAETAELSLARSVGESAPMPGPGRLRDVTRAAAAAAPSAARSFIGDNLSVFLLTVGDALPRAVYEAGALLRERPALSSGAPGTTIGLPWEGRGMPVDPPAAFAARGQTHTAEAWMNKVRYAQVAGALLSIAGSVTGELVRRQHEREQYERGERIREALRNSADEIVGTVLDAGTRKQPGWRETVAMLCAELDPGPWQARIEGMEARRHKLDDAIGRLGDLLSAVPTGTR